MSKRLVAVGAVLVLLLGAFLTVGLSPGSGTASAADNSPSGTDAQWIFFPWVPNGEKIGDTGPWYGSVIIQNIEDSPVTLNFGKDASGANFTMTATVQPHASYIYSASALGLPAGGGGIAVQATWLASQLPSGICEPQTAGTISVTHNSSGNDVDTVAGLPAGATITQVGATGQYTKGTDYKVSTNQSNSQTQITWISNNRPNPGDRFSVTYGTVVCSRAPEIAGVEKQASPASSSFGDQTSSSNTIVDGYAAVPMQDVAWGPSSKYCQAIQAQLDGTCNDLGAYFLGLPATFWGGSDAKIHFDGHSYLPIVQNNWNSWDSYIHITNVDASTPSGGSQVTVQFFTAGQGVGNTAVASYQTNVAQGATVTLDVAQALKSSGYDKDSFVGSAWITSDYGVVTSESRVKSPTSMLLISNSAPSLFATTSFTSASLTAQGESPYPINKFQMYAPLVYKQYNGWNTGINIMNLSEIAPNQVTVQIFDQNGNTAGQYTVAIPAKGMQYVYIPTMSDLGTGSYGSAVLTSVVPFQAQVDEVKYSTDEAMSYIATAAGAVPTPDGQPGTVHGNVLSLPLFQNGSRDAQSIQHGDTSGINLFNGGEGVINGHVNFYTRDGALANNLGSIPFTVGSLSQSTIYAPNIATMSPNIDLSAEVVVDSGHGILSAVSNNVNYDVKGDGSTAINLSNQWGQYRYICSQTNCGFRVQLPDGTIVLLPPWSGGGPNGTGPGTPTVAEHVSLSPQTQNMKVGGTAELTATVTDAQDNAVKGAHVTFTVSGPNAGTASPGTATATTDVNGHADFSYTQSSSGQDTVTATSSDLPSGVKATATVNWYALSLTTTPGCAGTNPCALTLPVKSPGNNGQVTYTVTLNGPDVSSIPVALDFSFKPANGGAAVTSTQHGTINVSGGTGTFSYTETQPNAGVDTVNAWVDIDNLGLTAPADNDPTAGPVQVTWEFVATLAADPSFTPIVYNPWPNLDSALYAGTDVIPVGKNVNLPVMIYGFNSSENIASGASATVSLNGDHYSSPGSASTNTFDCSNANYCTAQINLTQSTPGTDVANGVTLSSSGPGLTSGSATLQWYTISSSVTPSSPITVGNKATINISFDSGSQPLPNNIPIQLELTGPNFTGGSKVTLVTNGNAASYSYTGTIAGTDNYHAWLDTNANGVFDSATEADTSGTITWQAGKPDHIVVTLTGFTPSGGAPYTAAELLGPTYPIDGQATFTATVVDQYGNTVTTFDTATNPQDTITWTTTGGTLGTPTTTNAVDGVANETLTDHTAETDTVTAALTSDSTIQGSTQITWVGSVNVELKIHHTEYIPFVYQSNPSPPPAETYLQNNLNIGLIPANDKTTQLDVTITGSGTTCPVSNAQSVHLVSGSRDIDITGSDSCSGNVWTGHGTVDNNGGQNETDTWTAQVMTGTTADHTSNPVTLYWYTITMTTPPAPQTIGNQAAVDIKIDSGSSNLPAGVPVQVATTTGANTTNVITPPGNLITLNTNGSDTLSTSVSSTVPGDQYLIAYVDTNANGAPNVPDEGVAHGLVTWQYANIPFNFVFNLDSVIHHSVDGPASLVPGGYLLPADGGGDTASYTVAVTDQGGQPIKAGTLVCWVVNHSNDGGKTIAGQFSGSSQTALDPTTNVSTFQLSFTQTYAGEDTIVAYFPGANNDCGASVPDNAPSGSTVLDFAPNIALSVESKYASTIQTDPPTALVPVGQTTVVNAAVVGYTDANGANPMPGTMNLRNDTSLHDHTNGNGTVSVAFSRDGTPCNNTSCQYVSGALGSSHTAGSDLWQAELDITNQAGAVTVDSQNQALVQFYSVSLNENNPASATVGSSITLGMTVDSGSRNLPDMTPIGWKTTAGPGAGTGTTTVLLGNASVAGPYTETTTGTQQFTVWVDTNANGNLDGPQEGSADGQVIWNPAGTTNISVTFNGCAASQSDTPVLPTGNNVCQAGQYAFFTAHVTDANNNAVAGGTTIYWQVENSTGTPRGGAQYYATTTTNGTGDVSFSFSDTHVRQDIVRAFYSPTNDRPWNGTDVSGTNQVTWIAGPANIVNVVLDSVTYNGGNGNAPVTANGDGNYPIMNAFGDTATFTVTVTDANGNAIANQPVSLSIAHSNGNGGATVSPADVQCGSTDGSGVVTCSYVEQLAGSDVVTATAGSASGNTTVGFDPRLVTTPSTQSIPLDGTSTGSATFAVYGYNSSQPIPADTGVLLNVAGANPVSSRTLKPSNAGDQMTAWSCNANRCVSTKTVYSTTSTHAGTDIWSTSLVLDNNPAAHDITVNWTPTLQVVPLGQLVDVDTNGNATWGYTITVSGYTKAEITNGTFAINWASQETQGTGPDLGSGSVLGNDATHFDSGNAWTCTGDVCTATYMNTNVNVGTDVIGSTYQFTWTLTDPTGTALASPSTANTVSFRAATSGPPPTGPSLSVAVGPPGGPYGPSYTVATNPGSWQYQFTVTGVDASDLTNATLAYTVDPSSTYSEPNGTINPVGGTGPALDGPWTCSGSGSTESCTATFTGNNVDVTSRNNTSEVLDWTLNYDAGSTLSGNSTTVNYNVTVAGAVPATFDATLGPVTQNSPGPAPVVDGGYLLPADGNGNNLPYTVTVNDENGAPVGANVNICWYVTHTDGATSGVLSGQSGSATTDANGQFTFQYTQVYAGQDVVTFYYDPSGAACGTTVPTGTGVTSGTADPQTLTPNIAISFDADGSDYISQVDANDALIPLTNPKQGLDFDVTVVGYTGASGVNPMYESLTVNSQSQTAGVPNVTKQTASNGACSGTNSTICGYKTASQYGTNVGKVQTQVWTAALGSLDSQNQVETQVYTLAIAPASTTASALSSVGLTATVDSGGINLPDGTAIDWTVDSGSGANSTAVTSLMGNQAGYTDISLTQRTDTVTAWVDTNGNTTLGTTEGSATATVTWTAPQAANVSLSLLGCSTTSGGTVSAPTNGGCTAGQFAEVQAYVTDASNNPVANGTTVYFEADRNGTPVTNGTGNSTTTNGNAIFWYSNTASGLDVVKSSIHSDFSAPFGSTTVSWTAGAAANITLAADPTSQTAGSPVTVTATVTDANNNPVSGETVTFSVTSANSATASFSATTATTDSNGNAIVSYTNSKPGTDTVKAIDGAFNDTTPVTWTAGQPATLLLTANPNQQAINQNVTLTATVLDSQGNPLPGQTVHLKTESGSISSIDTDLPATDASGQATLVYTASQTGNDTIDATLGSLTGNATVTWINQASQYTLTVTPNPLIVQVNADGTTQGYTYHLVLTGPDSLLNDLQQHPSSYWFSGEWTPQGSSPALPSVFDYTEFNAANPNFSNISCSNGTCSMDITVGQISGLSNNVGHAYQVTFNYYGTAEPGTNPPPAAPVLATNIIGAYFQGPTNTGTQPGTPSGFTFASPSVTNANGPVTPTNGGYTLPDNGDPNTVNVGVTVTDPFGGNVPDGTNICWFVTVNGNVIDHGSELTSGSGIVIHYQDNYAGQGTLTVYYDASGNCGTTVPSGDPSSTTTITMNPNITIALADTSFSPAGNDSLALMPLGKSMLFNVQVVGYTGNAGVDPMTGTLTVDNSLSPVGPAVTKTTASTGACIGGTVCNYQTTTAYGPAVTKGRTDIWQATLGSMHSSNQVETQVYTVTLSAPSTNPTVGSSVALMATIDSGAMNLPAGTKIGWSINGTTVAQHSLSGTTDAELFTSTNATDQDVRVWVDTNGDSSYEANTEGSATQTIHWQAAVATNISVSFVGCSANQGGPAVMPIPPANACVAGDYAFFKAQVTDQNGNALPNTTINWQIERGTTFWSDHAGVTASTPYPFSKATDVGGNVILGEQNTNAGTDLVTAFTNTVAASNPPKWDGTGPYGQSFVTWTTGAPDINATSFELTSVTYVDDPTTGPTVTPAPPGTGPFTSSIDNAGGNTAHFVVVLKDQYGNPIDPTSALANGDVVLSAANAGATVTCTTPDASTPDGIDCSYNTNLAGTDVVNAKFQGSQVGPTIQITWNPTIVASPSLLTIQDIDTTPQPLAFTVYGYNSSHPLSGSVQFQGLTGFAGSGSALLCGATSCTATGQIGLTAANSVPDGTYTGQFNVDSDTSISASVAIDVVAPALAPPPPSSFTVAPDQQQLAYANVLGVATLGGANFNFTATLSQPPFLPLLTSATTVHWQITDASGISLKLGNPSLPEGDISGLTWTCVPSVSVPGAVTCTASASNVQLLDTNTVNVTAGATATVQMTLEAPENASPLITAPIPASNTVQAQWVLGISVNP